MLLERRLRIVYVGVGLLLALGISWTTHTPIRLSTDQSLWFEILVWILIAAFLLEPYFSGSVPAIFNSASVILIILAARFQGARVLWIALLASAAAAFLLLMLDYSLRNPEAPAFATSQRVAKAARQVGTSFGGWRFSLLAVLLVALVSFDQPFGHAWIVCLGTVLYALTLTNLQPLHLIRLLRGRASPTGETLTAHRVFAPAEVILIGEGIDAIDPGGFLRIRGSGRSEDGIALAPTYFSGRRALRVFVPGLGRLVTTDLPEALRVERETPDHLPEPFDAYRKQLAFDGVRPVGTVSEDTGMLDMVVELFPDESVELGALMWTLSAGDKVYWQVLDAHIKRSSWGGDTHRTVFAYATQLGGWDDGTCAFHPENRSPNHTELVFTGSAVGPAEGYTNPPGTHVIGHVPGSSFPVAVNLHEFTLHHAAILGITGTGKTHLVFQLVQAIAEAGVKVICVDTTGQYARRFPPHAAAHIDRAGVAAFLVGDHNVAVYSPAVDTITDGNGLASDLFDWAKALPPRDPDALARCVVIFEEAQNFVPEAFVIDDWGLKARAQATSRLIMESRKFGLGFMLVSQRTAMVTKSALSQCNTVMAFQAVDQTGLDYLEGLCGGVLVRGVPTLPGQTAITTGRGMTSGRPIIVKVTDAEVVVA